MVYSNYEDILNKLATIDQNWFYNQNNVYVSTVHNNRDKQDPTWWRRRAAYSRSAKDDSRGGHGM